MIQRNKARQLDAPTGVASFVLPEFFIFLYFSVEK